LIASSARSGRVREGHQGGSGLESGNASLLRRGFFKVVRSPLTLEYTSIGMLQQDVAASLAINEEPEPFQGIDDLFTVYDRKPSHTAIL